MTDVRLTVALTAVGGALEDGCAIGMTGEIPESGESVGAPSAPMSRADGTWRLTTVVGVAEIAMGVTGAIVESGEGLTAPPCRTDTPCGMSTARLVAA
jgi:hypothetical protein